MYFQSPNAYDNMVILGLNNDYFFIPKSNWKVYLFIYFYFNIIWLGHVCVVMRLIKSCKL